MTREDVVKSLVDVAEFIINNSDDHENAIDVSIPLEDNGLSMKIHYEFCFEEVGNE